MGVYLELGFDHILDPNGYDHILFVVALCAAYTIEDWKKLLILVTAFTVGHSLTLALASLRWVNVPSDLVETLIPITIFLTCIYNIYVSVNSKNQNQEGQWVSINYLLALLFGLIHGLGFSNFFRQLMGSEESILMPLLSFNIGVELGQIIVVFIMLILGALLTQVIKLNAKWYTIGISIIVGVISLWMIFQ